MAPDADGGCCCFHLGPGRRPFQYRPQSSAGTTLHTHFSPPHTPHPPPTHTPWHPPAPPGPPLPPHPSHSPLIPHYHTPRGRSCTPGFPGDRFSSLGGTGGLHPRYTRSYIHAAHHSRSLYTPPTRPFMTGCPQAETGTSVYCHRRRRRHRCCHDGAVAHLAQPPAATPRCRILPISSWLIGQDQSPLGVATEWDVDCPLDVAHSSWASSFHLPPLTPPLPTSSIPTFHSPPSRLTHTLTIHDTHTHIHTHVSASMRGQAMLDPGPMGNI